MTRLSAISMDSFRSWEATVPAAVRACGSFEEAAQRLVGMVFEQFRESVVLARLYAIIPYSRLPPQAREFALAAAASWHKRELLGEDTKVLTLSGTRGESPAWNSRHSSKGHAAIPLISAAVEEHLPMVARMIKELGFPMDWVLGSSRAFAADTFGSLGGFFYVEDAETALDDAGRRIIPARDFVASHGVRTVFGTAGVYVRSRMIVTLIVFCRETLDRTTLRQMFMPLGNVFTNATAAAVRNERLFIS
ncbi:MAG: hypothetical protein U1A78_13715 [Polyangia bacterium]